MMIGIIIRKDSGFYYVLSEDTVYECQIRGKAKELGPIYSGDRVIFSKREGLTGIIEGIEERKSFLMRPPIANADQLFIIMTSSYPRIDYNVLDRMLVLSLFSGLKPYLILNKMDEGNREILEETRKIYQGMDFPIFPVSALTGEGVDALRTLLKGKLTILAGPSGVGKTSLLNALDTKLLLETGSLGDKIKRGKHTTRTTTFYKVEGGLIADTPGFSRVDLPDMKKEELKSYYEEFQAPECKFQSCNHYKEIGCGVKEAVEAGRINRQRYGNYIYLLQELMEKEERRYR